jgi:hypothetical protein
MAELTVRRGDDVHYLATFRDINGNVQDLSGATIFFTVKDSEPANPTDDLTDATAFLAYHWAHDGSTVTSSEGMRIPAGKTVGDGQLEVIFPRSLTTTWAKINKKYEVQITLPYADGEGGAVDDTWDAGSLTTTLDLNRRRTTP